MNSKSLAMFYQEMKYAIKFFEALNAVNANKSIIGKPEGT